MTTTNENSSAPRFALALALPIALALPLAAQGDPCKKQAYAALKSCEKAALADYWLQRGKCENLASAAQRAQCFSAALDELDEAEELCDDQYAERVEVCMDLGGGFYRPMLDPQDFGGAIDNPYLPMIPGTTFTYEKVTDEGLETTEIVITHETKEILGIECVVVHDVVSLEGELIEDTFDWFAQDDQGNVWYMGETVEDYENGRVVSVDGSWVAGANGAEPGIVMPAAPQPGDLYRQEYLLGEAEDLFELISLTKHVSVPYGNFSNCLLTEDFSPLDPEAEERKYYAPGVGRVLEINVEDGSRNQLVDIEFD